MMSVKKRIFFSGLNELRAIAALAVLFHHIELYKFRENLSSLFDFNNYLKVFMSKLGHNGVLLFFVLSGFLITYLLIEEKKRTNTIHILKFYGRRALRIWPLYFVILIIGFFVLPFVYLNFQNFFEGQDNFNSRIESLVYGKNLLLYLFFLSNIAMIKYGPVASSAQSWSVSVEEQFYLIWPWIIKYFYNKLCYVLIGIIATAIVTDLFFSKSLVATIYTITKIDFMAAGGLLAFLFHTKRKVLSLIAKNKIFLIIVLLSLFTHLLFHISNFSKSLTFGFLIMISIENGFKNKLLDKLGELSYGIYMYHPLVMYFSFSLIDKLNITNKVVLNFCIYITICFFTYLISYISYFYFEVLFLKMKHKISPISSTSKQ